MYKRGRMNTALGLFLMGVGMCYLTDLQTYGRMRGRDATVSAALKAMRSDGYLDEIELKGRAGRKVTAVSLTKKGRVELLNVLEPDEYEYWNKYALVAEQEFHTTDEKTLNKRLENVMTTTMFVCADVPALAKDKPKLSELYRRLLGEASSPRQESEDKVGYAKFGLNECKELMRTSGVYYTIKEYRLFCEEFDPGVTDTFKGSRARGIFISDKNCYVVYVPTHGDNKMLKIGRYDQSFLTSLKRLLKITSVERTMPEFSTMIATEYGGTTEERVKNEVHALVISDGDSMVYSMAMGYARGKVTERIRSDQKKQKKGKQGQQAPSYEYIDYNCSLYKRVFVTPCTLNGISSLDYICHNSAEDWKADSAEVCKQFGNKFKPNENDPYYSFTENRPGGLPTIYMPAFEVCELHNIAELDYEVAIITYKDMLNAIAHSIRRDAHFYDGDTNEAFGRDDVYIYDKDGNIKGHNIIENELAQRGRQATKQEIAGLPRKFNDDQPIRFFNSVARGDIDINTFIQFIDTEEYTPSIKKGIKRKNITLSMGTQFTNLIRRAARSKGLSMSAYIKGLIYDQVMADNEAYTEKQATNKGRWKDR